MVMPKLLRKKPYYLDIFLSDTLALKEENGASDKNGIQYFKKGYLNFDFKRLLSKMFFEIIRKISIVAMKRS